MKMDYENEKPNSGNIEGRVSSEGRDFRIRQDGSKLHVTKMNSPMTEQQQIDNLLIPRVMVTNPWPAPSTHSECHQFKVGQVITEGPMYIMIWGRQYTAADLCAKYKGNFRLLDWWEREAKDLPEYVKYVRLDNEQECVIKVHHWRFNKSLGLMCYWAKGEEYQPCLENKDEPATSAQYLEYLNQQSK